ncbi:MAG: histidinol-phosphate aminotransferase family protein [Cyanobacteria bacterium K_Offshore_surface_m2_239]|nr:histidinol-phosphate aminotransferase family protein [Cyanobacteria bacterium K_Offshore_surface_m2_239]
MAVAPPERSPRLAPSARPEVESLQAYSAPLEGRRELLRLDFNENTLGPSPKVVEAIRAIPADHYAIYPEYDGLRQAVVAGLGSSGQRLDPSQIGLFNGVDAALHAIFHAFGRPGDRLLTTTPTFGYYAPCARMQGMAIEAIPYRLPCFSFPLEEIHSALIAAGDQGPPAAPRLLLICNPNNPTGTRLAPARLLELAEAAPHTLVVVDELYEAFSGDSVLPLLEERAAAGEWPDSFSRHPNLLVLRSLSKTAGLAGLRIGFAIGHRTVVDRLARVGGPYDVNSFAVRAAIAALGDQAYVEAYVEAVIEAKEWLSGAMARAGVRHHVDGGNYLLIWPATPVLEMDQRLREAGILVRSMAGKPLIDGSMRVSIGTRDQMERFWEAFQAIEAGLTP